MTSDRLSADHGSSQIGTVDQLVSDVGPLTNFTCLQAVDDVRMSRQRRRKKLFHRELSEAFVVTREMRVESLQCCGNFVASGAPDLAETANGDQGFERPGPERIRHRSTR